MIENDDTLEVQEILQCSECNRVIIYSEVSYDGPADKKDSNCNSFIEWSILCNKCVSES